jgi:NAD(P)-dependent dehydrogenase (short-subunit alcohol dehydrogenase family)
MNLEGRVAVVTGGGNGIGSGICQALAGEGAKIVVSDVDEAAAGRTAGSIRDGGGTAIAVGTDVSQRTDVEALAARTCSELGGVDIVCNNAGVLVGGPMLETTEDDWQWLLSVNLMGVVHGCQVFAPILLERGEGHIVNTASVGGFLSFPTLATYCTSKFAVIGFSEALQLELAPKGIGVSILCPGKVHSNLDNADQIRPERFANAGGTSKELGDLSDGMEPIEVGHHVIRGIRSNTSYIFTHTHFQELFQQKFNNILEAFNVNPNESLATDEHR